MVFVRRVKTSSGATAVQLVQKRGGVRQIVEHVGSAHDELGLAVLDQPGPRRVGPGSGARRALAGARGDLQHDLVGRADRCVPSPGVRGARDPENDSQDGKEETTSTDHARSVPHHSAEFFPVRRVTIRTRVCIGESDCKCSD